MVFEWAQIAAWEIEGSHFDRPSFLLNLVQAVQIIQQLVNIASDEV